MANKEEMLKVIYEDELFVPILDGLYFVSNYGRIWVVERYRENRHWTKSLHKWQIYQYKPSPWKSSPKARITPREWKSRMIPVSRLVANWFLWLDLEDIKTLVCHKDDDTNNNKVSNLFLWTHTDNARDMSKKMRWGSRVLNIDEVESIRTKYVPKKYTLYKLAKEYWVSYFTIYAIIKWISRKW